MSDVRRLALPDYPLPRRAAQGLPAAATRVGAWTRVACGLPTPIPKLRLAQLRKPNPCPRSVAGCCIRIARRGTRPPYAKVAGSEN